METAMRRLLAAFAALIASMTICDGCNEVICASQVSKCMLLKACACDFGDWANCTSTSCCQDCHKCLDKHYLECCSCVGMCTVPTVKDTALRSSTIEQLHEPLPALFEALTEEEDIMGRWSILSYPSHLDFFPIHDGQKTTLAPTIVGEAVNCTVAYMAQCMSQSKCKASCNSMGAARYRWFQEHGCCECVGSTCADFGHEEPLCLSCPLDPEWEEEDSATWEAIKVENSEP